MIEYKTGDLYDSMSREELVKLLRVHEARYKIIVQMDEYSLFRYDVETDTMFFWTSDKEEGFKSFRFPNYRENKPSYFKSESESHRIPDEIDKLLNDPNYPKTGAIQFRHKDGHLIECEYTAVKDRDGKIHTIAGQLVDYFRTPNALRQTIESMNDYIATIEGLKSGYETVLSINLTDLTFKVVKGTQVVLEGSKNISNVIDFAMAYAKYNIDEQYYEGFINFISPNTLAERMYGIKYISYDYLEKNLGWVHGRIVPAQYDNDGNVSMVLFTSEVTNDSTNKINYLQVVAGQDSLTGLYNRAKGEAMINEWIGLRQPAVFALFDCDHFKLINDTMGHPIGDVVLSEVAKAMREAFPKDVVMRLGGDEFIIYHLDPELPKKGDREILEIFDEMKKKVRDISIPELRGKKITISGGVAVNKGMLPTNFDKLYHKADIELYHSKQTRNGTISVAR